MEARLLMTLSIRKGILMSSFRLLIVQLNMNACTVFQDTPLFGKFCRFQKCIVGNDKGKMYDPISLF